MRSRQADFTIDRIIVELDAGGIFSGCGIRDFVEARPVNRGQAHRAWFAIDIDGTVFEVKGV